MFTQFLCRVPVGICALLVAFALTNACGSEPPSSDGASEELKRTCGNRRCDSNETCATCSLDCGQCKPPGPPLPPPDFPPPLIPDTNSKATKDPNVRVLEFPQGVKYGLSSVVDEAGGFAYVGTDNSPGRVLKVRLADMTVMSTLTLGEGENKLHAAIIDKALGYAYFGMATYPAKIVRINLSTFKEEGTITLPDDENHIHAAAIDPVHHIGYFGTSDMPGKVVKIDLANFERVSSIELQGTMGMAHSLLVDLNGQFAYVGTDDNPYAVDPFGPNHPWNILKIDLATFTQVAGMTAFLDWAYHLHASVIDDRYAYFATAARSPTESKGVIARVRLSDFTLDGSLNVGFGVHSAAIDRVHGYAYFGSEISEVHKVRLSDFQLEKTLSTWTPGVVDSVSNFWTAFLDSNYVYTVAKEWPTYLVRTRLSDFTTMERLRLPTGEDRITAGMIDPAGGYAYIGIGLYNSYPNDESKIVRVRLSDFSRQGTASTLGNYNFSIAYAQLDAAHGYGYFVQGASALEKVRLSDFNVTGVTLPFGPIRGSLIDADAGYLYFAYGPSAAKVRISDLHVMGTVGIPGSGLNAPMFIDPAKGNAYFSDGCVTEKVPLSDFTSPVIVAGPWPPCAPYATNYTFALVDSTRGFAYLGGGNSQIAKVSLPGLQLVGTMLDLPEGPMAMGTIDPDHDRGFFVTRTGNEVIEVQLSTMTRVSTRTLDTPIDEPLSGGTALMDPLTGNAYLGLSTRIPAQLFQVKTR